jgi:hypothetical protein
VRQGAKQARLDAAPRLYIEPIDGRILSVVLDRCPELFGFSSAPAMLAQRSASGAILGVGTTRARE